MDDDIHSLPPNDDHEPDFEDWEDERDYEADERDAKIAGYRKFAREVILEMLLEYHAVVPLEIVARAGEYPWRNSDVRLDQHHLNYALAALERSGTVVREPALTRGGRNVVVLHLPVTAGRKRVIERASARKRLLDARYLGWASGTERQEGLLGPTAERVVHRSILEAAPVPGFRLVNPVAGAAAEILGVAVRRGPLDNAVLYNPIGAAKPYVIPVEVKSLRPWIYPRDEKLYQLLYKAAMLADDLPDVHVLPVLVCRKAHFTLFRMARELGFHVVDTMLVQWLPQLEAVKEHHVIQVREGLGYVDIHIWDGTANKYLVKQFATVIPREAERITKRWSQVGRHFAEDYVWLWDHRADQELPARRRRLNGLRAEVNRLVRGLPVDDRYLREGGW